MDITRRDAMKIMAGSIPALSIIAGGCASSSATRTLKYTGRIQTGPYSPTWESLVSQYQCPEWFRDAKFGFMEFYNLWKADKWEPEKLMDLYKRAGAKYFVSMANHHDNFDAYDSKYHAWNSVNVGPKKDIVGTWAKIARANGLRFGVSNHSAHSWHWFQTAYSYDGEGPLAGVRYDAYNLTKEGGKGKWWEGLDPQDLYCGRNIVMPDGITGARAVSQWHERNTRPWSERALEMDPEFTETWFLRCRDLIDKYQPDLLYFDNIGELPLEQAGLDIAAHFYNNSLKHNKETIQAVLNVKGIGEARRSGVVEDYERGSSNVIQPAPWQTDTCIGEWHYNRSIFEGHRYKTVEQVVQTLLNVVSKNGNLLLSIPVRGDGTIDEDEVAFLEGMAKWMDVNSEGIFASRPWKIFGEGPTQSRGGMFSEGRMRYTAQDFRFTTKGDTLYAFMLGWPDDNRSVIKSLASNSPELNGKKINDVSLLGYKGKVQWTQDEQGLTVQLPDKAPSEHAVTLKIKGV